jgi:hypothetical protein
MAGRPSSMTPKVKEEICERIAKGESLRKICLSEHLPSATAVHNHLLVDKQFVEQYARAKQLCADYYAEQIIDISDDGINDTYLDEDGNTRTDHDVIARSRLRVDARKWYASKLNPKKYGDKVATELTGKDGAPIQVQSTMKNMSDDDLATMQAIMEKAVKAAE